MGLLRRRPLADLVKRQLDLFASEHASLLADCEDALREYDAASGEEAEERYGDYVDLVDAAAEELERVRETYARTLDDEVADDYRDLFTRAARKRFPRLMLEPD